MKRQLTIFFPGREAKMKWKNVKDKFRIELHKIPDKPSGSAAEDFKSKWPLFDLMLFAKDTMMPSTTWSNLSQQSTSQDDSDEEIEIAQNESDPDVVEPTTSASVSSASYSHTPSVTNTNKNRIKKRPADTEMNRYLEIEQKKLDFLQREQKEDAEVKNNPDYHFLMSLLPYFEELDALEKLEVRGKIQDIMIKALRSKRASLDAAIGQETHSESQQISPQVHHRTEHNLHHDQGSSFENQVTYMYLP